MIGSMFNNHVKSLFYRLKSGSWEYRIEEPKPHYKRRALDL